MKKLQMLAMMAGWLMMGSAAIAGTPNMGYVPVPGVWALIAAGVGALYLFRRK